MNNTSAQNVQWAYKVDGFSSEYIDEDKSPQYRAIQVLGKPNKLPTVGSSPCAWSPAIKNGRYDEWIKVSYKTPIQIRQVVVGESHNGGAVTKVFLYDENNQEYLVYKNLYNFPLKKGGRMLNIYLNSLTPYKVKCVKIVLTTIDVSGWNHIDCIGISSKEYPIKAKILLGPDLELTDVKPIKEINSPYEEVVPVISPDGKTLYFDRKNFPTSDKNVNDDIWYTKKEGEKWSKPIKMKKPLNNSYHNFVSSVMPDGNTLILGNVYLPNGDSDSGVSISERTTKGWSFPQKLEIDNFYNDSDHSEFSMSVNRNVLVMAIRRKGDTYGDRDLYVSFRKSNNTWTEPKNLGPQVNSAAVELTPVLAADNKTLYFSSEGFSGYGGPDMYVTKRLDNSWTNWSEPVNLGPIFNSPEWDASFTLDAKGEYAYFVSYKNSESNSADIFKAQLPKEAQPDPVVLISGKVYNAKTKKPIKAMIYYESLETGKQVGMAQSNGTTGKYKIVLPKGKNYGFRASAKGFFAVSEHIDLKSANRYDELNKDLYLVPMEIGQHINLNNVFFVKGKADLKAESYPELDRLAEILLDNESLVIQVIGHTDYKGSPLFLSDLSQRRVNTVVDYLSEKGVDETRLSGVGKGGAEPVYEGDDMSQRSKNRRVEFKIMAF